MQFDPNTVPRKTITIAKLHVEAPMPYAAGHVLTEGEAAALNQVFHENVRNSMAAQITKAQEELQVGATFDLESFRPKIEAYFQSYEFGTRNSSGSSRTTVDPVEREALSMARSLVTRALKAQGHNLKAVGEETIMSLSAQLVAAKPAIREEAARAVAARKAVGALNLGDLNMAGLAPAPTAEAPAPAAE